MQIRKKPFPINLRDLPMNLLHRLFGALKSEYRGGDPDVTTLPPTSTIAPAATGPKAIVPATPGPAPRAVCPVITRQAKAITFTVSDVSVASAPLPELPCRQAVIEFLGAPIESCSSYQKQLVAKLRSHPLIGTLHVAFASHRPVVLSPDIIWLTLTQGFAHHINSNAERFRHQLVGHGGKANIIVRRDDFVKGSPENPWPEVFAEFAAAIKQHIGPAHGLVVADFSTTGPTERAASEIVLMDSMQAFFAYELHTLCGIPSITLEGTVQDWQTIANRVREFSRFDLDWWIKPLQPILKQFVAAASGEVDGSFWDSIYKWKGPAGSGSPFVSGWITTLFPYLENRHAKRSRMYGLECSEPMLRRSPWLGSPPSGKAGPSRDEFPSLPAKAPFLWKFLDAEYAMEFIGGLIGIRQEPQTLRLRPEVGWAIREVTTDSRSQSLQNSFASKRGSI